MKNIKKKIHKIIIIGSGPAGYTAAIYSARANLQPLLITGIQKGGQLIKTNSIENWPGRFKKTTGLKLMQDLETHAINLKTKIIQDQVIKIDFSKKILKTICEENIYYSYSAILATGSSPKFLNIKNEKKYIGKGISTCAICDGFFYKSQIVAVVGGGNTAIEEVLYLSNIASKVYLIHRNKTFKAEKILIKRLFKKIKLKNIILYTDYIINKIIGNEKKILSIEIINKENQKKKIHIAGLFIAIGSVPNTKIFQDQIHLDNGYIKKKPNENSTKTNVPGVFAAGEVVDYIYKQAITSSAHGCMAALDAEKYLNSINTNNKNNIQGIYE